MSVQYKSSDGWKNISSSSNNAVDTVENGNMNPVTSNAVYDALNTFETIPITPNSHVTSGTITCKKCGHLVEVNLQSVMTDIASGTGSNTIFASGFPKPAINVSYNCFTVHANAGGALGSVNIRQSGEIDTAWAEGSQNVTYQGSFTYLSAE
jgi:hypothetical protein